MFIPVIVAGAELTQYTYQMLKAGVDRRILRLLSDENLRLDCHVENGVHRMKIMEAAKSRSSWPKVGYRGQKLVIVAKSRSSWPKYR